MTDDKKDMDKQEEKEEEIVEEEVREEQSSEDHNEKIEALEEEKKELQDKLLRQAAETENVRNRNIKLVQEARDYAVFNFAKDMIMVRDNLQRALEHIPDDLDDKAKNIIEGVKMTSDSLGEALKKNSIDAIEPKAGDKFDYNLHCAISQQNSEEFGSGSIISVMQCGYKIKDRLIRAASVVVAK